jgi:hypothetical protein
VRLLEIALARSRLNEILLVGLLTTIAWCASCKGGDSPTEQQNNTPHSSSEENAPTKAASSGPIDKGQEKDGSSSTQNEPTTVKQPIELILSECTRKEALVEMKRPDHGVPDTWLILSDDAVTKMIDALLADERVAERVSTTFTELGNRGLTYDASITVLCEDRAIANISVWWNKGKEDPKSYSDMRDFFDGYIGELLSEKQIVERKYIHLDDVELIRLEY